MKHLRVYNQKFILTRLYKYLAGLATIAQKSVLVYKYNMLLGLLAKLARMVAVALAFLIVGAIIRKIFGRSNNQ